MSHSPLMHFLIERMMVPNISRHLGYQNSSTLLERMNVNCYNFETQFGLSSEVDHVICDPVKPILGINATKSLYAYQESYI